jgi:hypothetical protein
MRIVLILAAGFSVAGARPSGTKMLALAMATVMICGLLFVPQPAYGQFGGLGGITSIFNAVNQAMQALQNFLNNVMRPLLDSIRAASQGLQSFLNQLQQLWTQVVWPAQAINQAKALAQHLIATFRGVLNGLYGTGVNSAQLANPAALEIVMRNKQVADQGALAGAYSSTFGALPAVGDAHPEERNLIDADDAMAIDQLMTLKMADASADQVLQAAQAIENEATRLAPGTAAMVSASAYIAVVQSQAHMQKMIAGQLRQEAARMAHDTMTMKRSAIFTRESRDKMTDLNK